MSLCQTTRRLPLWHERGATEATIKVACCMESLCAIEHQNVEPDDVFSRLLAAYTSSRTLVPQSRTHARNMRVCLMPNLVSIFFKNSP